METMSSLRCYRVYISCLIYKCLRLSSENVTVDDIKRVSSRMLASKPSVAALGNLANLPKFEEIERAFGNRGNFSGASRFFLFRN